MTELIDKLKRNAKFYENEAFALGEVAERRDRRKLGASEAGAIAVLLREAVAELEGQPSAVTD